VGLIRASKRPFIYAGGGVIISGANEELRSFAEKINAPVACSLMGIGAMPPHHELYTGMIGMHGTAASNRAVQSADLLIAVGARFSDRVTVDPQSFAPEAQVIHIDIDPAEIGKNRQANVPIVGDARLVLAALIKELQASQSQAPGRLLKPSLAPAAQPLSPPMSSGQDGNISPQQLLGTLNQLLQPLDFIVTTDVGQHQMWAAQNLDVPKPRRFLSSGGLGTMGFGLPAAIGAQLAWPKRLVLCISGDGSWQMNSQEMSTARALDLPIKALLLNNSSLGLVRQWQQLFYAGRYSQTSLPATPDFVQLAEAHGWEARRLEQPGLIRESLDWLLQSSGPAFLEAVIAPQELVQPMHLPGGGQ
jgi:acetolactate synthase-1/2/3 large subunit